MIANFSAIIQVMKARMKKKKKQVELTLFLKRKKYHL